MLVYEILSFAQAVLSVFCGSINGNLLIEIWCSRRVWSDFYGWQLMIADHDDVFCYDSSILPTMNKSSRNLVPDIEIAVHPWHWAPLSVVSMMVSVWHSRTLEGSALDLFPLKFGKAPQTSPWFLPLSFFLYLESPKLSSSWFSVPLGFLLISRMLILKHLNYTSAMSFLLYFQDGKSPVRGSWNLLKYSDNGGQNSRRWLSACL